jgi:hypothetical protein
MEAAGGESESEIESLLPCSISCSVDAELFFLFVLNIPSVVSTVAGDKLSFKFGVSGGRLPCTS